MTLSSITPRTSAAFGRVCRALDGQPGVAALLKHIAELLLECSHGADAAVVTVIRHRQLRTGAATAAAARQFESAQIAAEQGPIPDVVRSGAPVDVADWATETRWPALRSKAETAGIRAQRSYPLAGRRGTVGIVTLFGTSASAFADESDEWLLDLLVPCGIAVATAQLEADLRTAVESRDVIGQAKGILMERFKIGPEEAFQLLVSVSQSSHRKLHDIAEEFARTGAFGATS